MSEAPRWRASTSRTLTRRTTGGSSPMRPKLDTSTPPPVLGRLDGKVGGPAVEGVHEQDVDEAHDGGVLAHARQTRHVDLVVLVYDLDVFARLLIEVQLCERDGVGRHRETVAVG